MKLLILQNESPEKRHAAVFSLFDLKNTQELNILNLLQIYV